LSLFPRTAPRTLGRCLVRNSGTGPEPYPGPGGTFPFTATDSQVHRYSSAGRFDLKLVVRDDDGGTIEFLVVIMIADQS